MTTEMHFNIPEGSVLNRLDRFSTEKIAIIVDRHAPPPTGKLVKDPEGEWVRLKDIQVLLRMGGLYEANEALTEQLLDGDAQRQLLTALENMGYQDFDQVMTILKNNRHQLLDKREFEIWIEGYQATGNIFTAQLVGKVTAFSFHEAVEQHVSSLEPEDARFWNYSKELNIWTRWGCRTFDNEQDARKAFG